MNPYRTFRSILAFNPESPILSDRQLACRGLATKRGRRAAYSNQKSWFRNRRRLFPLLMILLGSAVAQPLNAETSVKKQNPLPKGAIVHIPVQLRQSGMGLCFSLDSRFLALPTYSKGIDIWEVPSRRLRWHLPGTAYRLAIAPDNRNVFASGEGGIAVWNLETGRRQQLIASSGPGSRWDYFTVSLVGSILATALDGEVRLHDWTKGKELRQISKTQLGHSDEDRSQRAVQLVFSPDGRMLAGVMNLFPQGWRVYLWDVASGKLLQSFGEDNYITAYQATFSHNGHLLACALGIRKEYMNVREELETDTSPESKVDRVIAVWELASGKEVIRTKCQGPRSTFIAFTPDGRQLFDLSNYRRRKEILLWDARTGKAVPCPDVFPNGLKHSHYHLSPNCSCMVTVEQKGVTLWDVSAFQSPAAKPPALKPAKLDQLWSELASEDITIARRAVWSLVDRPQQCVPLLRDRLVAVHSVKSRLPGLAGVARINQL
jgi:WD40 repeat protein